MAVSFELDSVAMPLDPHTVEWEPKEVIDRNHDGAPLENIKRTATLRFDPMTTSDFSTIEAHDDGATHSAKIPRPTDGTYTTYSNIYVRVSSFSHQDINVYDVELEISWIEI
jgi:hypothetical protein